MTKGPDKPTITIADGLSRFVLPEVLARCASAGLTVRIEFAASEPCTDLAARVEQVEAGLPVSATALARLAQLAAAAENAAEVVHETRNLVGVILGFVQLAQLAKERGDPSIDPSYLDSIERDAKRCVALLQRFLGSVREDSEKRTRVDVRELATETAWTLTHRVRLAELRVRSEIAEDVTAVDGNRAALRHVLLDLLFNAIEASPRGGEIVVAVANAEPGWIELTVSDEGPGVASELRERIFEPFFTTKPEGQGTGLGLAMCRRVVLAHGGSIAVTTGPAGGARFTVRLPSIEVDAR